MQANPLSAQSGRAWGGRSRGGFCSQALHRSVASDGREADSLGFGRIRYQGLSYFTPLEIVTAPRASATWPHYTSFAGSRGERKRVRKCHLPALSTLRKLFALYISACTRLPRPQGGWDLAGPLPRWESPDGRAWDPETLHEGVWMGPRTPEPPGFEQRKPLPFASPCQENMAEPD